MSSPLFAPSTPKAYRIRQLLGHSPVQLSIRSPDLAAMEAKNSVASALTNLYRLFTKLPYIPPECLMIPPESGWTTINDAELRRRGKSDGAIDLLRHLPYLKQRDNAQKWTVGFGALHLNYAEGEMYDAWLDEGPLPLPGHVIWLTKWTDNYGTYWLLDTETLEAIEYRLHGENEEVDYETSEATPPDLKWTIQTRMPAAQYFDLWRHKFETLEYFIVPDDRQWRGTAEIFQKLVDTLWEDSLWPSDDDDDEFNQDYVSENMHDIDSGTDEDDSANDLDESDADWEMLEDTNELEWLEKDKLETPFLPFGQFRQGETERSDTFSLVGCRRSILFATGIPGQDVKEPCAEHYSKPSDEIRREDLRKLSETFARNGWPFPPASSSISTFRTIPVWGRELDVSGFDRASCHMDLLEFMRNRHAKELERCTEENEAAAPMNRIAVIRHRLQKLLLLQEVTPSDEELSEVSTLLNELDHELGDSTITAQHVKKSKILKVLRAALTLDAVSTDAIYDLKSMMQFILDNWADADDDAQPS